ncbi:uncharacterized protein O3C94_023642 [Discoglossus pictus]
MKLFAVILILLSLYSTGRGNHHEQGHQREIVQLLQNANGFLDNMNEILSGIPHVLRSVFKDLNPDSCPRYNQNPSDGCTCEYHNGGCVLSGSPPAGKACQCKNKGVWKCTGDVTQCLQPDSPYCQKPDNSLETCLQGGGNCDGYDEAQPGCDCTFHHSGCRIDVSTKANTACKCIYTGSFQCRGQVVACKESKHEKCIKPDTSKDACLQGAGDCSGYEKEH